MNHQPQHMHNMKQQSVDTTPAMPNAAQNSAGTPPQNLDFILSERSEKDFKRAAEHSNKVRFWKVALPVFGLIIIACIAGALMLRSFLSPDVTIDNITVTNGKLVMENPTLNGYDDEKRPFLLTASRAIQDAKNPTRVELQNIFAELPYEDDTTARINADNAVYDADLKTLVLNNKVKVETDNGMKVELSNADVNLGTGTLVTNEPVFASSPQADISASKLLVEERGGRLVFEGNVKMVLRPGEATE